MLKNVAMFVLGACALLAQPNTLTQEEKKEGWKLLFDGKTMNGWEDPRQKNPPGDAWSIEDGMLHVHAKPAIEEDLFTKQTFRDFELKWEWRISPKGNSGLKYRIQDHFFVLAEDPANPRERFEDRVQRSMEASSRPRRPKGQDYVVGFEYQLTDDAANRDALSSVKHASGALYDMTAPVGVKLKPVGEFNESRLVVRGKHVEHWLNGVKVVDTTLDSEDAKAAIEKRWGKTPKVRELLMNLPRPSTPISLQCHNDDAWFRSIKVRELK